MTLKDKLKDQQCPVLGLRFVQVLSYDTIRAFVDELLHLLLNCVILGVSMSQRPLPALHVQV